VAALEVDGRAVCAVTLFIAGLDGGAVVWVVIAGFGGKNLLWCLSAASTKSAGVGRPMARIKAWT